MKSEWTELNVCDVNPDDYYVVKVACCDGCQMRPALH